MNKARILIVEDEAIVAADIAIRLDQLGYKVVGTASRGDEALAMAEHVRLDLVLMDIHLQGEMDGIEAARELRSRLRLPVVFLTAYGEGSMFQRAKEADPLGYILKPFEDRELRIVIEMALYKHQTEEEMKQKYAEIDRFNQVTVGRELRMLELKHEVNELLKTAGKTYKYKTGDDQSASQDMPQARKTDNERLTNLVEQRTHALQASQSAMLNMLEDLHKENEARQQTELALEQQLDELRRWQNATLGREGRIAELKQEVNALTVRLGLAPPYATPES